jgi:hypothetical protein
MAAAAPLAGLQTDNGAASPPPAISGRQIEFFRRLRRAIGPTGVAWGAAAVLLGLLSLAIAAFHSQVTRDMVDVRGNRATAADVISASNHLDRTLIAVLTASTGDKPSCAGRRPIHRC